jgi:hypothetical protein
MFIFGHQVVPDNKEDGSHRDHKKRKGSMKVQHTGCNHQGQETCPGGKAELNITKAS